MDGELCLAPPVHVKSSLSRTTSHENEIDQRRNHCARCANSRSITAVLDLVLSLLHREQSDTRFIQNERPNGGLGEKRDSLLRAAGPYASGKGRSGSEITMSCGPSLVCRLFTWFIPDHFHHIRSISPLSAATKGPLQPMRLQPHRRAGASLPGMWDGDMIRIFIALVLSLAALWLTVMWIATFIWPADYSFPNSVMKLSFQNGQRQMQIGIVVWDLKDLRLRRFTWMFLEQPNLDPSARPLPTRQFGFLSFHYSANHAVAGNPNSPRLHIIALPASTIVFVAWLYPMICLIRRPLRKLVRKRRGLCLQCGYNLTGSPEPRCSECGIPIVSKAGPSRALELRKRGNGV